MTIISAPKKATAIAHLPLPATLLSSHPVRQHFALTVKQLGINGVTMEFSLLDPDADSGHMHSLLGCIVDYAAQLAAHSAIGACTLLEQELRVSAPVTATSLYVSAQIDSASARYAIFQCAIYAQEPGSQDHNSQEPQARTLIADSQGTLLKRSPATASQ